MPRVSPMIDSFVGGEISKIALARTQSDVAGTYGEVMRNVILLPTGGLMRRPGFRYTQDTKGTGDKVRLVDFQFNTSQAYIMEVGNGYLRFFADLGQLVNGTAAVEVATPWVDTDPFLLDWAQSADLVYFAHPDFPPHKLERITNTNWILSEVDFVGGPLQSDNSDQEISIRASGTNGVITLTAAGTGADVFDQGHVGSVFRISESSGFLNTAFWVAEDDVSVTGLRQSNGRVYQKSNGGTTPNGVIAPGHAFGTQNDGVDGTGNDYRFRNNGHGFVRITAVANQVSATGEVVGDAVLPLSATQPGGTSVWAGPAWSEKDGYPSVVTFADQRAVWASTKKQPSTFWMTAAGDFENFEGPGLAQETEDEDPINRTLDSSEGSVNTIQWAVFKDSLFFGTDGGVFRVSAPEGSGFTPRNISAVHVNSTRCSTIPAIVASSSVLFPRRSNRKLHELSFSFEFESFDSPDLNVLAEDILSDGIVDMAWQDQPNKTLWIVTEKGELRSMLFDRVENTIGWCRHDLRGAKVESIATIPGAGVSEDRDELWAIISNDNGRYVGVMERDWRSERHSLDDAYFLDLLVTITNPTGGTVGGLQRLANQEIAVWADGRDRPRQVVNAFGEISLAGLGTVSKLQVGLAIDWEIRGHRLDHGSQIGTAVGKRRKIVDIVASIVDTTGFKIGDSDDRLFQVYDVMDQDLFDEFGELLEGDFKLTPETGFDGNRDPRIIIKGSGSGPAYILALAPTIHTSAA